MIRIRNCRADTMIIVELPEEIRGGQQIKRGVIDRLALMGDGADDAKSKRPELRVTKILAPANITLLPRGKRGDTSEQLPDAAKTAPDVVRKQNLKLIEIVEE